MLIAQITDVHLGFESANRAELNRLRLDDVLDVLRGLEPAPDLLIVSGDLAETGTIDAYRDLRRALADLAFPAFLAVGNHDVRANFFEAFPDIVPDDGFVQYVIENFPLRIVVGDTLEEGRHDGAFCEARVAWLERRLGEAPKRPTLLVVHHPPVPSGIDWMTTAPDAAWTRRLRRVVERNPQIVAIISGHLHRSMVTTWAGIPLITCASTAPQVALDFKPMDGPDMRPLIVEEPPAFALHRWRPGDPVMSYFGTTPGKTIVPYDAGMGRLIQGFKAERKKSAVDV